MFPSRTSLAAGLLAVAALWATSATARSSLYSANCTACHSSTVNTCNGCHAHGTHSGSAKNDINVAGTIDKTSYAPGETVTVTVSGGYRSGWVRALLLDEGLTELARSSCPGGVGGCTTSVFPVTFTAPAPTTPGTYGWAVAWYGNEFDIAGASFGSGTSATLQPGFYTPDAGNPGHGFQTVALPVFTVAAPSVPALSLSPGSLTFPTVTLGGSAQQTTEVQNTGTATLSVTGISRCTGTSTVFGWSPAAPFDVPAGGSATLTVTYTPLVAGTDSGCLAIASNDPVNPTVELGLSGTAVAPAEPVIALDPPSLAFGSVLVGGSGALTTQVRNTGTATLEVSGIARCSGTSTEYGWAPAAPFSVLPGESAALTVTYAPVDVGSDTGCLAVASNAATSPTELALSGAGTAVPAPDVALDPAALDFGEVLVGSTQSLSTLIRNVGTAELSVFGIELCSGTSTVFGWTPPAPFAVPAGGSVTLTVTYAPVLVGADTGCLAVSTNDPDQPTVTLDVTGRGVTEATPSIALVPSALDFGSVTVGATATRTTEIQNAGTAPLQVTGIARCTGTGTAWAWSPPAPFTITAGMTETLTVSYSPTAAGPDDGCLAVSSDDPLNPIVSLALTGTAVEEPVAGLDVDLDRLKVKRKVRTHRDREITPRIKAENEGFVDGTALATVVGMLDGTEIYRQSISITLPSGEEGSFRLPPYSVPAGTTGVIHWTATLEDEDPDVDQVTAMTWLIARGGYHGDDRDDHDGDDDRGEEGRDDDHASDDRGDDRGDDGGDRSADRAGDAARSVLGARSGGCNAGGQAGSMALALVALGLFVAGSRRRRSG